ncbi:uncharacterized protein BDZ83DRAFT_460527 [Colletotrichum acutatum]|uniref:Uncharacterized protein n=1 Tax=Glomerella acutata TaxID=27357 RepID=A0AAD8XFD8_GLOAC|nr:uncharacterized protein BDZ83DRAFT_460527 [Colletotrichum acutatum]KAK1719441.1 hypothetical protein BDZ83DRAFT_460527 [Colletotrichum acutatum]
MDKSMCSRRTVWHGIPPRLRSVLLPKPVTGGGHGDNITACSPGLVNGPANQSLVTFRPVTRFPPTHPVAASPASAEPRWRDQRRTTWPFLLVCWLGRSSRVVADAQTVPHLLPSATPRLFHQQRRAFSTLCLLQMAAQASVPSCHVWNLFCG